jgi:hypothetical protein
VDATTRITGCAGHIPTDRRGQRAHTVVERHREHLVGIA